MTVGGRLRTLRSTLRTGQAGISLPELLVAMALAAVVMTLVVTFFATVSRTLSREASASSNTETASLGMRELTRVLRSGTEIMVKDSPNLPVFLAASAREVTLHGFLDTDAALPKPLRVNFRVTAAGELIETRWAAVPVNLTFWEFSPTVESQRVIIRGVAGTEPVLRYFSAAGTELVPATITTAPGALPVTGLSSAQLREVVAVEIRLSVQTDPSGRADPIEMLNTVGIPNLGISRVGAST